MFGTTCVYESIFITVNFIKYIYRSRFPEKKLVSEMRCYIYVTYTSVAFYDLSINKRIQNITVIL